MNEVIIDKKREKNSRYFLKLLWIWMALSSWVFIEPAPYDIMMGLLLMVAFVCSLVLVSEKLVVPIIAATVFINANLISLFFVSNHLIPALEFLLITIYLIGTWVFLLSILQRFSNEVLVFTFGGYTVAALISTVIGILAYWGLLPMSERFLLYGEIAGLFKDPNVYGPFLIPVILLAISRYESLKGARKLMWLGIGSLLSVGVLLSYSRAAWGNLVISLGIYFLLPTGGKVQNRTLKLIFLLVAALGIGSLIIFNSDDTIKLLNQKIGYQGYDNDRFGTQWLSLKMALENPLGIGPYQTEAWLAYSTHSLYIRVLTENGVIGFFALILLIISTIVRSLQHCLHVNKQWPYLAIVTASLGGILFNSLFIDTLHWRHFWFLLAIPWMPLGGGGQGQDPTDSHKIG